MNKCELPIATFYPWCYEKKIHSFTKRKTNLRKLRGNYMLNE